MLRSPSVMIVTKKLWVWTSQDTCWVRKSHVFQGVFPASLEEVMKWWLSPGDVGHKTETAGLAIPYSNEQIHSTMRLWWQQRSLMRNVLQEERMAGYQSPSGFCFLWCTFSFGKWSVGLSWETGVSSPYLRPGILKSFPLKMLALECLSFPLDDKIRLKSHMNSSAALAHLAKNHMKQNQHSCSDLPPGWMKHWPISDNSWGSVVAMSFSRTLT